MPAVRNLAGRTFGAWRVLHRAGRIGRNAAWMCRCACGNEKKLNSANLLLGRSNSCGCGAYQTNYKPGLTVKYSSEYNSWRKMIERCINPKHERYKNYGGRGIKVCARWREFKNFLEDMGQKPSSNYTIDRKDVHQGYEPNNCRWATRAEQWRNTTRSIYVEYEGRRILLNDLVNALGLKRGVVYGRLKAGWPLANALSIPVRSKRNQATTPNVIP